MKITYRECDACGERIEYREGQFPKGWASLHICGGKTPELCVLCVAPPPGCCRRAKEAI